MIVADGLYEDKHVSLAPVYVEHVVRARLCQDVEYGVKQPRHDTDEFASRRANVMPVQRLPPLEPSANPSLSSCFRCRRFLLFSCTTSAHHSHTTQPLTFLFFNPFILPTHFSFTLSLSKTFNPTLRFNTRNPPLVILIISARNIQKYIHPQWFVAHF